MLQQPGIYIWPAVVIALAFFPGTLWAGDASGAKRNLDMLEHELASGGPEGLRHAQEAVDTVEQYLDGLDAATRQPLQDRLNADKQHIAAAALAQGKKRYLERINGIMEPVRKLASPEQANVSVAFAATLQDVERAEKELKSDDAMKFLDDATTSQFAGEIAVARHRVAIQNAAQNFDMAKSRLKSAEQRLPDFVQQAKQAEQNGTPEAIDSSSRSTGIDLRRVQKAIAGLPPEYAGVAELQKRVGALQHTFDSALIAAQGKQTLAQLTSQWTTAQALEPRGWDSEPATVSLASFSAASVDDASALGSPKTVAMLAAADRWLAKNFAAAYKASSDSNATPEDSYGTFLADPQIKALYDEVAAAREAAAAKLAHIAAGLMDDAEKGVISPAAKDRLSNLFDKFPDTFRGAPQLKVIQKRLGAMLGRG